MKYIGLRRDSKIGEWLIENTDYIPADRWHKKYILQTCKILEGAFSSWGILTSGMDFELVYGRNYFVHQFLGDLGFEVQRGDQYISDAYNYVGMSDPYFPANGYIKDCGEYLVVNFGW
jgi:hypothetical protein